MATIRNVFVRATIFLAFAGIVCVRVNAADDVAGTKTANDALKEEVARLKEQNQLQRELNDSRKLLLESQKNVIDMQKQLATSQKDLLDAMFPKIEGGKTGTLTLVPNADIGPLAQPAAFEALTAVIRPACVAVKTKAPLGVIVGGDTDLQLAVQYRIAALQLDGLSQAYKARLPANEKGVTLQSLPAGLAIYGAGALAKQLSSFLQLFWEDRTVYFSQVSVDERSLHDAMARCLTSADGGVPVGTKTIQSAIVGLVINPSNSYLFTTLSSLSSLRYTAEGRIQELKAAQDAKSVADKTALEALNTQYDALLSGLLASSDDKKAPTIIALLSGEALATALTDQYAFLAVRVVQAAGIGVKTSSLWHADRLNTAASLSISYRVINANGHVLASGVESTTPMFKRAPLE